MTMDQVSERTTKGKTTGYALSAQTGKRDFLRLAAQMAGIVDKKSSMPILSCVRLTARDGAIAMDATDLYQSLTGSVVADVETTGTIAVSAKDLVDRVKAMPDGPLILEVKDNQMVLKTKVAARRYTLRGIPGEDFPPMPTPADNAPRLAVPAAILRRLIARTHYAVSTDETRAHLNSALLEWEGERVRMVATDGHRLALADVEVKGRSASQLMLLPLRSVHEVARICDEVGTTAKPSEDGEAAPSDDIEIMQNGPMVFFRAAGLLFGVKSVDAQFPPYQQVIPKETAKNATVPRSALSDAVRAVSIAAAEKTGGVKLVLTKKKIRLSSESPDNGDGADEVDVDYDGPSITIGFNARYLIDALGALSDEDVAMGFAGELDPIVVRADEGAFVGVIMPMRI